MTEHLITDSITGRTTWVSGATVRDALLAHENALRAAPGRHHARPAQMLPATAAMGSDGDHHWIGDSARVGLPCWTVRAGVIRDAG